MIGIITWHDFFKFVDLNTYDNIQHKFRGFIRRTADVSTNKPESVGHIMTKAVVTMEESVQIAELIPLMSIQGHKQIPIINAEKRLVGMVFQSNLIAALYNQKLAYGV